jgi:hypothetical protein
MTSILFIFTFPLKYGKIEGGLVCPAEFSDGMRKEENI